MLWNIRRGILIIILFIQLFFYSVPCFCFRSIPLWHCIPTCFQVPIVKQLEVAPSLSFPSTSISRNEGNTKQQQVQLRPKKQYISGDSYKKHYSSPDDFHQFNNLNLAQKQQYEENESWQPYHHSDEPIIYVAETTPNPYDELIDPARLTSRQHQPISMLNRYDDYLLEALNDISNLTTSMHPAPISAIKHSFENISIAKQKSVPSQVMKSDNFYPVYPLKIEKLTNPDQIAHSKGKLKWTSFNVLKRQKTYSTKNAFQRNYPAKRAAFPSAVCNSRRLRKIILQAITADVSESKRSVMEAAEHAYQGIKFDVICAEGDFSYTIHAKKYCEVTKENMTCFAFR